MTNLYAPTMHGPRDLPAWRLWLCDQWKPTGAFARIVEMSRNDGTWALVGESQMTPDARDALHEGELARHSMGTYARWDLTAATQGELLWVDPFMVDLLDAARESVPDDVTADQLELPSKAGVVVFARPLVGLSRDGTPIRVDAITWGYANLPPLFNWADDWQGKDADGVRCLSVSSYARLPADDGLTPTELSKGALVMGLMADDIVRNNPAAVRVMHDEDKFASVIDLHDDVWAPLGRSDWPLDHRIDQADLMVDDAEQRDSFMDDRRLIAALFTLLHQEGIAGHHVERPARPIVRRVQRAGFPKEAANVRVITLRRIHQDEAGASTEIVEHDGTGTGRKLTKRVLVNGHWRNQPYGKGRALRRLIWIAPYVKGPDDGEWAAPTTVKAWVR